MERKQIGAPLAVAAATLALFFAFAGDGLRGYFAPDEMMNLYQAWFPRAAELMHHDRPLGMLVYRALFGAFGLHPLPYRVFCLALVLVNLALLYRFAALVSGSREVGALALLAGAYHPHLADLYYTSANVFDLGCFLGYFSALIFYVRIRRGESWPDWRQTSGIVLLYGCALGFKEMAVTLPVVLVCWELVYNGQKRKTVLWRSAPIWLCGLLTIPYVVHKVGGPHAMTQNPDYALHLSPHMFLASWAHYLTDLGYRTVVFGNVTAAAQWIALLALAAGTRQRDLLFSWCLMMVGALPVLFVAPRGLFALYVTLPGWYLYGSRTLLMLRDALRRWVPRAADMVGARPEQLALFGAVAVIAVGLNIREKPAGYEWVPGAFAQTRPMLQQLASRYPALKRGAHVLFLSDPCPPHDYIVYFILALQYRDPTIHVDRAKDDPSLWSPAARERYDYVFMWADGRLQRQF